MQESSGCSNDSVSLTDTATGIELFKLCGHQVPHDVMSSNNEMTVVFTSDSSVTKSGFVISYEASSEVFGMQTMPFSKLYYAFAYQDLTRSPSKAKA